jgi:hypothetical protein
MQTKEIHTEQQYGRGTWLMARWSAPINSAREGAHPLSMLSSSHLLLGALAAVTLVGLAVRLYGLTDYGIWFDEAYHIQLVKLPSIPDMIGAVLSNPPSDPLYVLLLRGWTRVFGYEDGAVRMLSVLFSTATVPATYWLGRVFAGRMVGIIGALMLAVSPYAVELGQEAALYALASLLTTLALAAGWRWRTLGRGGWIYLTLGILAIYSHYVVAAILLLFALFCTLRVVGSGKLSMRSWLIGNTIMIILWLPWLVALVLSWVASPQTRATLRKYATLSEVAGALVQFSSGSAALLQREWALAVSALSVGVTLLAMAWMVTAYIPKHGLRIVGVVSALIFFVPAITSRLTGLWLFIPHFMLFLLPALFVLLAAGLELRDQQRSRSVLSFVLRPSSFVFLLTLWLLAQLWGLALYYRYPPHGADGLRELAATLRTKATAGDAVFVTPPVLTPTLRQYYAGPLHGLPVDFDLRAIYLPYDPPVWNKQSLQAFEGQARGVSRFWLVYRPELDEGGQFLNTLRGRYRLVEQHKHEYATLYLFETP